MTKLTFMALAGLSLAALTAAKPEDIHAAVAEGAAALKQAEADRDQNLKAGEQAINELQERFDKTEADHATAIQASQTALQNVRDQLDKALQDGGASAAERDALKDRLDTLQEQLGRAESVQRGGQVAEPPSKPAKGHVWFTAPVTVSATDPKSGKISDVPPGQFFQLPEEDADDAVERHNWVRY